MDTQQVINAIGRKRLESALGVTKGAVANVIARGKFPARWYVAVRDLSADVGIDCPLCLFNFAPSDGGGEVSCLNEEHAPFAAKKQGSGK